ncbi:hypothetical protein [Acinetobacter sp.]|uniref:hypothetical protein n=1 Tax=Acinetobacter sp. TaxID=472 RepID=UPI003D072C65
MRVIVPGQARLLRPDGAWIDAADLVGDISLLTYHNGKFDPVSATVSKTSEHATVEYRSGTYRHLITCEPLELLSPKGWTSTIELHTGPKLSTHHMLAKNVIEVPRLLPIYGTMKVDPTWIQLVSASIAGEKQLVIPAFLTQLDAPSLKTALGAILRAAYPEIDIFKGDFLKRTPHLRLRNIEENSRRLLVHLFARLGVRARRWEDKALMIKENRSKQIIADLLDIYHPRQLTIDTTMTDWIWSKTPQGPTEAVVIESPAENICDGLFIWRPLQR